MAMSLAQMRTEIRSWVNEADPDFFTNAEIEDWVNLGAWHVSALSLHACDPVDIHIPAKVLTDDINQLTDDTLSGTPRILPVAYGGNTAYLKVYPTYGGSDTAPDPEPYRTFDDAVLSGDQKWIGFRHGDQLFWTMGYVDADATANPTGDNVWVGPYAVDAEGALTGSAAVFCLLSDGIRYYFKGYTYDDCTLTGNAVVIDPGLAYLKLRAVLLGVATESGGSLLLQEDGEPILLEDGTPLLTEGTAGQYGNRRALLRTAPAMLGHLINTADYPIYYMDWANQVWIHPAGTENYSITLYPAQLVLAAADLPYDLQIPAMKWAMGLAQLKDEKMAVAIDFLMRSTSEAYFYRETLYGNDLDARLALRVE